jgi:hypothetical protein
MMLYVLAEDGVRKEPRDIENEVREILPDWIKG